MQLRRTSLVRDVYRALISNSRTYGAFTSAHESLARQLAPRGELFDPMSGYGGLTRICERIGARSFCVELNPPQYLWQVLLNPALRDQFASAIEHLHHARRRWPRTTTRAAATSTWFPPESREILLRLFDLLVDVMRPVNSALPELSSLALLLPFAGRFASCSASDLAVHVKQGGICVYSGWHDDFAAYLTSVADLLRRTKSIAVSIDHSIVFGDAKKVDLGERRFPAMMTSPPYPNWRDFAAIFAPENAFMSWLATQRLIPFTPYDSGIIGSFVVSGQVIRPPRTAAARRFLDQINSLKRSRRARYDDEVYYLPYFTMYFSALEDAYDHEVLSKPFQDGEQAT